MRASHQLFFSFSISFIHSFSNSFSFLFPFPFEIYNLWSRMAVHLSLKKFTRRQLADLVQFHRNMNCFLRENK